MVDPGVVADLATPGELRRRAGDRDRAASGELGKLAGDLTDRAGGG
jgi:hypothetical protein